MNGYVHLNDVLFITKLVIFVITLSCSDTEIY